MLSEPCVDATGATCEDDGSERGITSAEIPILDYP
jgi:hypothetical protein